MRGVAEQQTGRKVAFTLFELLIVLVIIGIEAAARYFVEADHVPLFD